MTQTGIALILGEMYQAGKQTFPECATDAAKFASALTDAYEVWRSQLQTAGNAPPLADAVAINLECVNLLRRVVIFLEHGAESLVAAADDFAKTDHQAASHSDSLRSLMHQRVVLPAVPAQIPGTSS